MHSQFLNEDHSKAQLGQGQFRIRAGAPPDPACYGGGAVTRGGDGMGWRTSVLYIYFWVGLVEDAF